MVLVSKWLYPGLMPLLMNLSGKCSLLLFDFDLDFITWDSLSNGVHSGILTYPPKFFFTTHLIQLCSFPTDYLKVCSHSWFSHTVLFQMPLPLQVPPFPCLFSQTVFPNWEGKGASIIWNRWIGTIWYCSALGSADSFSRSFDIWGGKWSISYSFLPKLFWWQI